MKRVLCAAVLTASAFSFSVMAKESRPVKRGITVPFDFKVHGEQMPAGEYRIKNESQGFVTLENLQTGQRVHVLREGTTDTRQRKLKFKVEGETKVLERVV